MKIVTSLDVHDLVELTNSTLHMGMIMLLRFMIFSQLTRWDLA